MEPLKASFISILSTNIKKIDTELIFLNNYNDKVVVFDTSKTTTDTECIKDFSIYFRNNIKYRIIDFFARTSLPSTVDIVITRKGFIPYDKRAILFELMLRNYNMNYTIVTIHEEVYRDIQKWQSTVCLIAEGTLSKFFLNVYEFIDNVARYTYIIDPTEEDRTMTRSTNKVYLI